LHTLFADPKKSNELELKLNIHQRHFGMVVPWVVQSTNTAMIQGSCTRRRRAQTCRL